MNLYPHNRRYRHPCDTVWKAHPLMAVVRDALIDALQRKHVKHPDSKRTRRARLEAKRRGDPC